MFELWFDEMAYISGCRLFSERCWPVFVGATPAPYGAWRRWMEV